MLGRSAILRFATRSSTGSPGSSPIVVAASLNRISRNNGSARHLSAKIVGLDPIQSSTPQLNTVKKSLFSTSTSISSSLSNPVNFEEVVPVEFDQIVEGGGGSDGSEEVMRKFEKIKQEKGNLTIEEYKEILETLAENRDFPNCSDVFQDMKAAGLIPDSQVYSLVLKSVRRTLRINETRFLFGDSSDYKPSKFADQQQSPQGSIPSMFFEKTKIIIQEMEARDLHPEMWFYEDFANSLAASNQAGVLINIATAMEKRGITPSTKFYNKMIYCLPRCGYNDRAGMLFNRMILRGIADYHTFLTRASSLIYLGHAEQARQVLSEVKSKYPLDKVAYNILIKTFLEHNNVDQAIQIFNQMVKDHSISPDRVTCRTFLSYFYETGNIGQAQVIINAFNSINFPETTEDFGNLIKFYARYDTPKVLELMERLETDPNLAVDLAIYHAFLKILSDRQVTSDWKKNLGNLILGRDFEDQSSENLIISDPNSLSSLCSELPFHFRQIIAKLESEKIKPDSETFELVMRKFIQMRKFPSVQTVHQYMMDHRQDVPIQASHRNLVLTSLLSVGELEGAQTFAKSMQLRRFPISKKNLNLMKDNNIELPRGIITERESTAAKFHKKPDFKRSSELNFF